MSFGLYLVGYALFIVGLAYVAHLLHMPLHWIGAGVLVLVGLGIFTGVTSTRQKDQSS